MPDNCYPTIIPTIDNSELECCETINSQCVIHLDELPNLSLPEDSDLRTILNEIDTYLSSGGASTFLELTDTPSLYTGEAGNFTRVNVGETALEFFTLADVAISNDYNDLDNLPNVGQPTGLEAIDEGNGIGWRLIGIDPDNYGNAGLGSVDLSTSLGSASTTIGATGRWSNVSGGTGNTASSDYTVVGGGANNIATGQYSTIAGGQDNDTVGTRATISGGYHNSAGGIGATVSGGLHHNASAFYSAISGGENNEASGAWSNVSGGRQNISSGNHSSVIGGFQNQAFSWGEIVGGLYSTTYTPSSTSSFNATDRILNIGNGTSTANRRDAFTIFKNGASLFVPINKSTVSNGTKGMYIYDSVDDEPKYHDGSSWNSFGGSGSGEVNTYSDLGAGEGITGTKTGVDLPFKSLLGGANITLTSDANTITISTDEGQVEESASFTLDNTYNNKVVIINNGATNITITVDTTLSNGFKCGFVQRGTGTVTFVASGTTLNSANGLIIDGQYNQAFIEKRNAGTNEFFVLGNLTI